MMLLKKSMFPLLITVLFVLLIGVIFSPTGKEPWFKWIVLAFSAFCLIKLVIDLRSMIAENHPWTKIQWEIFLGAFSIVLAVIAFRQSATDEEEQAENERIANFAAIKEISGSGYVIFDRVLTKFNPMNAPVPIRVTSSKYPNELKVYLSISELKMAPYRLADGTVVSRASFKIDSAVGLYPNEIHKYSSKTFFEDFDYFHITLGAWEWDACHSGVVYLSFNNERPRTLDIARTYPGKEPANVIVPLNDKAKSDLEKYARYSE